MGLGFPVGYREDGGAEGDRTPDLRIANATLSQLSYGPMRGARTMGTAPRSVKHRPAGDTNCSRPGPSIVMSGAAGLNAAKNAAIAWHTAPWLTPEEARRCAVLIPCSAL